LYRLVGTAHALWCAARRAQKGGGDLFKVRSPSPAQPTHSSAFPALLKYIVRNIDNDMVHWNVIALINGAIEAVSGPAAQDRPGAHEWIVWEGPASDKAEALKFAEKADPRVDLGWMRIRHERNLDIR